MTGIYSKMLSRDSVPEYGINQIKVLIKVTL